MRILITNDDGIDAEGVKRLALTLKGRGHSIMLAAPSENQSCVGHGLTLRRLIFAEPVIIPGLEDCLCYSIGGTPVDCIRLSIDCFEFEPDLVVSGINHASNLGTDTLYSGTVSAALEAGMLGLRSIAVSKDTFTTEHMQDAAEQFADMLPELYEIFDRLPEVKVLSVNIPSLPRNELRGIRTAELARQQYSLRYKPESTEDGKTYYSVTSVKLTECADDDTTDERFVRDGYVVVSPLTYDLTDNAHLEYLRSIERDFNK